MLSAPPPETGFQVLHTLELLEPFDLKSPGLPTRSAVAFDVLASALRVGQAAARGNADPNWVPVPANGISSARFAAERKGLVGTRAATKTIAPADARPFDQAPPAGACSHYEPYGAASPVSTAAAAAWTPQLHDAAGERADEESGGTTHMSVVDAEGNAVPDADQQQRVGVWSGGFARGFFLNNSGYRFTDENINAPSRRIRSTTIAPTIALRDGAVQMAIGAPGGGRIPTEIVQVMVYTLDYGLDPLDAVKIPRIFPSATVRACRSNMGLRPRCSGTCAAWGTSRWPNPPDTRAST